MAWGDTGWGNSAWGSTAISGIPSEPVSTPDQRDTYKSVLMRRTLSRAFNRTRASAGGDLAKWLAIIGDSDNDIGGLFGAANFLTDDQGLSS